jgi:hypothetical protein
MAATRPAESVGKLLGRCQRPVFEAYRTLARVSGPPDAPSDVEGIAEVRGLFPPDSDDANDPGCVLHGQDPQLTLRTAACCDASFPCDKAPERILSRYLRFDQLNDRQR